jgi:hypothetical protein
MNASKFASRKFSLVCVSQLAFVLLLWVGKLDQNVFESLTMIIISGYIIGNVTQKTLVKEV